VAAAQVIADHGWHGFTLERVAEAAELSRVTLYRRGVTRDLLADALVLGAAQAYQAALWPALTRAGSGAERLEAALRAICEVTEEHLRVLAALEGAPDPVFHLDAPDKARLLHVAALERLVRDGLTDGTLQTDDPSNTAVLLLNVVPRTYVHLRVGHQWPPERVTGGLLGLVLAGLRTDASETRDERPADPNRRRG
jgi:AcrR family transcriptional regulator